MTGRSLLRRLLRNPLLLDRWEDPNVVPYGAWRAMEAVADMVAASGDTLEFRPDPDINGGRSLADLVARRSRAIGAEDEVLGYLSALVHAGLLVLTDEGGLRLPLPERAVAPAQASKAATNRANAAYSTGPRPKNMSDEDWDAHKKQVRRRVDEELSAQRRQGTILFPITGGGGVPWTGAAGASVESQPQSQPAFGESQTMALPKATEPGQMGSPVALASLARADSLLSAAAAPEKQESNSLNDLAAAAARRASGGEKPNPPELALPEAKPKATDLALTEPNPDATTTAIPREIRAQALAAVVATVLGLTDRPAALQGGTTQVREWLAMGLSEQAIERIARERQASNARRIEAREPGVRPIGSFRFLDAAMREEAGVPRPAPQSPALSSAPSPDLPARMVQPWISPQARYQLKVALELALAGGPAEALAGAIGRLGRIDPRLVDVLLVERPELRDAYAAPRRAVG